MSGDRHGAAKRLGVGRIRIPFPRRMAIAPRRGSRRPATPRLRPERMTWSIADLMEEQRPSRAASNVRGPTRRHDDEGEKRVMWPSGSPQLDHYASYAPKVVGCRTREQGRAGGAWRAGRDARSSSRRGAAASFGQRWNARFPRCFTERPDLFGTSTMPPAITSWPCCTLVDLISSSQPSALYWATPDRRAQCGGRRRFRDPQRRGVHTLLARSGVWGATPARARGARVLTRDGRTVAIRRRDGPGALVQHLLHLRARAGGKAARTATAR